MMQQQGKPSIREMCRLAGVSRAAYHRHWRDHAPREQDTELRSAIQQLALEDRHNGYRRIHGRLTIQGWKVNHKRVLRLMREDNLLWLRRKAFVKTTRSDHELCVYPNRAHGMKLNGLNQLWVADITYIHLREEFVYLAMVMDAFSRRVIGWAIEKNLQASLALHALEQALANRPVPAGLVHHSDRGVQYACAEYVSRLERAGIGISMSRIGTPWDNAKAESFMKTLKAEAVDGRRFRDLEEAKQTLVAFIEEHYNQRRMHSALEYRSPVEFEQMRETPPAAAEFTQA
jgi:putative transposase